MYSLENVLNLRASKYAAYEAMLSFLRQANDVLAAVLQKAGLVCQAFAVAPVAQGERWDRAEAL